MLEVLREDFLDRDRDTFVKIRRTGRLGWESLVPSGGSYSDLLRDCRGEDDVIKEAYGMARDCIGAMDTPYRVTLRLSPEANCTDSKVVYLSTRVFDDGDLSEGQKVDTFVGLAVHEGCHLKWTDFSQMASEPNGVIRNLINVMEDERIERLCGEAMPGYANFLKAAKYYMFDLYRRKTARKDGGRKPDAPVRLLNAILSLVRYPSALEEEDLEEFTDELYEVREVLLDYPVTSPGVTDAARAVYEIIRRYFERRLSPDGGRDTSEAGKEPSGSGKDRGEDAENGGKDAEERRVPGNGDDGDGEGAGEWNPQGLDPGEGGGREDPRPPLSGEGEEALDKAVDDALAELEGETEDLSELSPDPRRQATLDEEEMADCVKRDSCRLAGICENMVSLGDTPGAVLYRAPEDREGYEDSLRRVRRYIPAIAGTLRGHCRDRAVTYRGMRSGLLDTGKLAEAFQGVQTVYVREGLVRSDRMAVCVLIDESGSMYGEKIRAARDLAVLLNESVATVPSIDLYVYGHTFGDRCRDSYSEGLKIAELQVYREKGYAPRRALGSVESRSGNIDSFAIREAAARMRRLSPCRKNLMFVITDGAPNERYEQLRDTVKELEKQGLDIVAVCIEPSYDPSMLYTHHVRFSDLSRLAIDLGKMIKKAILRNAVRHSE